MIRLTDMGNGAAAGANEIAVFTEISWQTQVVGSMRGGEGEEGVAEIV